jgi:hypothetical protein
VTVFGALACQPMLCIERWSFAGMFYETETNSDEEVEKQR